MMQTVAAQIPIGMLKMLPVPSERRPGGKSVIHSPPINNSVTPRNAESMPSVAMIDGTRPMVTSTPFNKPIIAPPSSVIRTTAPTGRPNCCGDASTPISAASRPSSDPTEMSISPVMMTKVSPQPTMIAGTHCTSMSAMFNGVSNAGFVMPAIVNINASMPVMPTSRRRAICPIGGTNESCRPAGVMPTLALSALRSRIRERPMPGRPLP